MPSKKRRRQEDRARIHPKNKYSGRPPDFALLASLYPSFKPYVFYNRDGGPRIDWTDFNATRELTRLLLLHDHNLHWWIPDGQLCPTELEPTASTLSSAHRFWAGILLHQM
ncbi:hypothetical protein V6N12_051101 [Hibiscus sabdariffa]|uniref:Uncharacterized protein n=1 Tax=Hibiscus sabdariffa TaxID=183260 RepID=A0ABR2GFG1_9ROSI